ncbi:hypothetical protein ACFLS9_05345, partial [Bacteroidota bacterium]
QEDISWPSLADSPWPMYRGDPLGSSRSKYTGPQIGTVDWIRDSLFLSSGLSIGYNNTIYTVSNKLKRGIHAVSPNGQFNWTFDSLKTINDLYAAPLVLKDSTIITTTGGTGNILALDYNGNLKWIYDTGSPLYNSGITAGKDGTIYATGKYHTLFAFDNSGNLLWSFNDDRIGGYSFVALSFSPDGRTLYIQGKNVALVAFDIEIQQIKWTFGDLTLGSNPLVDTQGNIYILTKASEFNDAHSLYSLKPDGTIKWIYEHNEPFFSKWEFGMAMDKDGNIYFAFETLYSVNYEGKLNWKHPLSTFNLVHIVVDDLANIYLQLTTPGGNQIPIAFTQSGDVLWEFAEPLYGRAGRCGALGILNRWYITSHEDENIYCIK